jgi:hypothetical protein
VLAAPVALGAGVALTRRPFAAPTVELSADETVAVEGSPVGVRLGAGNPDRAAYDLMLVRLRMPTWVRLRHGDRPYAAATRARSVVDIELHGEARRWGRHAVGPATGHAVACDGLLVSAAVAAD